ncbi:mitochondrial glycoprotein [Hyaloraphidium curvatum]|nr:mitochondrial glycoprotein [Hyaloraphidium curvatum]
MALRALSRAVRPISRSAPIAACAARLGRTNGALASVLSTGTPAAFAGPRSERLFASSASRLAASKSDKELAAKLTEEYQYELENNEDGNKLPEFLESFNKQGLFKIEDKAGEKQVKLTRTVGNETISVLFATDSMSESEWEAEEIEGDEDPATSFVVRCTAHVTKKDAGTLEFSLTVSDREFLIDAVNLGSDSALMLEDSASADWKRSGLYGGPVFEELDDDLQALFAKYLEDRGFNGDLAEFIAAYIEYKEQNEYVRWLQAVGQFVEK